MPFIKKIVTAFALLIVMAAVSFVGYGIATDCPNTVGYVHCYQE